jgi:hypothetical protein
MPPREKIIFELVRYIDKGFLEIMIQRWTTAQLYEALTTCRKLRQK